MRSSSTLPVPQPSSASSTPTRTPGALPEQEEEEERGDLICFYNHVYIKKIKQFALRYSTSSPKAGVRDAFFYKYIHFDYFWKYNTVIFLLFKKIVNFAMRRQRRHLCVLILCFDSDHHVEFFFLTTTPSTSLPIRVTVHSLLETKSSTTSAQVPQM